MNTDDTRDARKSEAEGSQRHEEQVAFRGELGDVCANAATNTPELCGSEEPVVDADGQPLRDERHDVPRSAPKK